MNWGFFVTGKREILTYTGSNPNEYFLKKKETLCIIYDIGKMNDISIMKGEERK